MNNQELLLSFQSIMNETNPLVQYCRLKEMKKQYVKSDFYKQTRINIYKAFEIACKMNVNNVLYRINTLLEETNLADFINDNLQMIHLDTLINSFLQGVNYEHLTEAIHNIIPDIDIEQLNVLTKQLKEVLPQN